jgi:DNA (cytosine-5)-methyltransferase 1
MKVISLFSGAGGMDLGFLRAGHSIVWANDTYADAVASYRNNIGAHIHEGAIECVSPVPHGDIVIGGFPCQGFSVANRTRRASDSRNTLYLELLRVLKEKRPLYFVAENVKGIYSLDRGAVFRMILNDLRDAGYGVQHAVLNAADYGVPQRRERVFIVGYLLGTARPPEFPPRRTHANPSMAKALGLPPWVGVGEALRALPAPGPNNAIANHDDWSAYKLRFNGHLGHRRVNPALPAPTLTARGDEKGGVVVIHHPSNKRRISPREAATIQGFPTDFVFSGTRTSVYRQVANAVCPPVAQALAVGIPLNREDALTTESAARPRSRTVPQPNWLEDDCPNQLELGIVL